MRAKGCKQGRFVAFSGNRPLHQKANIPCWLSILPAFLHFSSVNGIVAGNARGRSPLAGARGVLTSFPFPSSAAAGGTRKILE